MWSKYSELLLTGVIFLTFDAPDFLVQYVDGSALGCKSLARMLQSMMVLASSITFTFSSMRTGDSLVSGPESLSEEDSFLLLLESAFTSFWSLSYFLFMSSSALASELLCAGAGAGVSLSLDWSLLFPLALFVRLDLLLLLGEELEPLLESESPTE